MWHHLVKLHTVTLSYQWSLDTKDRKHTTDEISRDLPKGYLLQHAFLGNKQNVSRSTRCIFIDSIFQFIGIASLTFTAQFPSAYQNYDARKAFAKEFGFTLWLLKIYHIKVSIYSVNLGISLLRPFNQQLPFSDQDRDARNAFCTREFGFTL